MAILNPCKSLNDTLETKLLFLESTAAIAEEQVNNTINSIEGYNDVVTSVEDITSATDDATASAMGIDNDAISTIDKFDGSCLESVLSKIDSIENDITSTISDAMDTIPAMLALPELSISQALKSLESLLGTMNINGIIDEIDRILGCLSEQTDLADCQTKIVSAGARVDEVIATLKLTDTGVFDFDTFTTGLATSASFIANLKSIKTKMDDLETTAVETITSVKPPTKVPSNLW